MSIENDPPIMDEPDMDGFDDELEFDDSLDLTEDADMGAPPKEKGRAVKLVAGLLVLGGLAGGGYYAYSTFMTPDVPVQSARGAMTPPTPVTAAVETPSTTPTPVMAPVEAEPMPEIGTNDLMAPDMTAEADFGMEMPQSVDGIPEISMGMPPQPGDSASMSMDAMPANDMPIDTMPMNGAETAFGAEGIPEIDFAGPTDNTGATNMIPGLDEGMNEGEINDALSDLQTDIQEAPSMDDAMALSDPAFEASMKEGEEAAKAQINPRQDIASPAMSQSDMADIPDMDAMVANDTANNLVDEVAEPAPDILEPAVDDNAAAAEIDEALQQQLIDSLLNDVPPSQEQLAQPNANPANNGQIFGSGVGITADGNRATLPTAQTDLQSYEEAAVIRETPRNLYVLRQDSAPGAKAAKFASAQRALKSGRNESALSLFDELLDEEQNNVSYLLGRAVSLQRMDRFESALEVYERVLTRDPENLDALTNVLGILSVQTPDYARDQLQRLSDKYPSNVGIKVQLAIAKGDEGDMPSAIRLLTDARRLDPESPSIAYNLGVMHDRMRDAANAARYYREALIFEGRSENKGTIPEASIRRRLSTIVN